MALPIKDWRSPLASQQKVLAGLIAYGLSRRLNRSYYEVVNESHIDLTEIGSDVADVVAYDVRNNFRPALIIEICGSHDFESTIRTMEIIIKIYKLEESFTFNSMSLAWYRVTPDGVFPTAQSSIYDLNMSTILEESLNGNFLIG